MAFTVKVDQQILFCFCTHTVLRTSRYNTSNNFILNIQKLSGWAQKLCKYPQVIGTMLLMCFSSSQRLKCCMTYHCTHMKLWLLVFSNNQTIIIIKDPYPSDTFFKVFTVTDALRGVSINMEISQTHLCVTTSTIWQWPPSVWWWNSHNTSVQTELLPPFGYAFLKCPCHGTIPHCPSAGSETEIYVCFKVFVYLSMMLADI